MGTVNITGIGPGNRDNMTFLAYEALKESEIIIGYTGYIKFIPKEFRDKDIRSTGMRAEEERCRLALQLASEGKQVSLICSGDSVVYGMAGLVYELASDYSDVEIKVIPGITAALSGSALLGAAVGNDFAVISLSDYLTPKNMIYERLKAAAKTDMVIVLYNPCSNSRPESLREAVNYLLDYTDENTPCGVASNIGREGESGVTCILKDLPDMDVDMFSTVFIGNSKTRIINGKLITSRGYRI